MCSITGIYGDKDNVCLSINNALTVLQHRGQDAAGMATANSKGYFQIRKGNGLVRDVFNDTSMSKLIGGSYGIGHTR